jgi:hypothetical protein
LNVSGNTTLQGVSTCVSSLNVGGKIQFLTGTTGAPTIATNGGTGDTLTLKQGTGTTYPYSIGLNTNNMWYSIPSGISHNFYVKNNLFFACDIAGGSFGGNLNAGCLIYEQKQALSTRYLGLGGGTIIGQLILNNRTTCGSCLRTYPFLPVTLRRIRSRFQIICKQRDNVRGLQFIYTLNHCG